MTDKKHNKNNNGNEIKRLCKAFGYSMSGIKTALNERAFILEVIISIMAIPTAFFISENKIELILLVGSLFLVMIVELLNTGIESAIDRISDEIHPLSKKAKDIASAAVLLSLINATFVWLVILLG
ncbi:MAG: diacylglycerol kinase [Rickettsiales bacterium]